MIGTTFRRPAEAHYRPDIDGLRALAVLAVMAFHAFPSRLPGGFAGVDVFFVISGYLISGIILRGVDAGSFSYWDFYARRIRRIFPALIVVLVVTAALGWWLLLPSEYAELGKHVAAGSLFSSNLLLWSEAGYFDTAAERKPLLHLWSLGVEEQFYLLWPMALVLIARLRTGRVAAIALIAGASFVLNLVLIGSHPSGAFYLPFTRFWELLIGACLAAASPREGPVGGQWRNLGSFLGAGLIGASFVLLSRETPFPGWYALVPAVGTALVIAAGPGAWLNRRLLSPGPVVFLGLISYPLYLWHWPLLSFIRILEIEDPALVRSLKLGALALALIGAILTYRYVELPLRGANLRLVAVRTALAMLPVSALGALLVALNGVQSRFDDYDAPWGYWTNAECLRNYPFDERHGWWFCVQSSARSPTVMVLGNSHANHLYPGLAAHSRLHQHTFLQIGTCNPTLGIVGLPRPDSNPENPCLGERKARQELFVNDVVRRTKSLKFAILSATWPAFDAAGMQVPQLVFQSAHAEERGLSPLQQYLNGLSRQVALLEQAGLQVVFFLGTPGLSYDPRLCLDRPLRPKQKDCHVPAAEQRHRDEVFRRGVIEMLRTRHPGAKVFDPVPHFCTKEICSFVAGKRRLLRDPHHLSEAGSEYLATKFVEWAESNLPALLLERP